MTLWNKEKADGAADYDDSKPNWLSEEEKARCYCDDRGWVLVHLNGTEEVLVAGGGLNHDDDTPQIDAGEKTAAETAKAESLSDDDGDGIRQYQDPDDGPT